MLSKCDTKSSILNSGDGGTRNSSRLKIIAQRKRPRAWCAVTVESVDRRPVHYVESEESDDELEADEVDSDTALTSSEALAGGALVAIIVAPIAAVLVIVAVIVAGVCCCRKKKEEKASATGSADVASVEIKTSV